MTDCSSALSGYSKGACMQYVLIIHEVGAYPAWKTIFDQATEMRKQAGEISYQLLRYDNDANKIVHFSEWSSLDKARRFFESPELVNPKKSRCQSARLHVPAGDRAWCAVSPAYCSKEKPARVRCR